MQNADIWLTPVIILPGVCLLLISTAARAGQLHNEFRQLTKEKNKPSAFLVQSLFTRAQRFRNALAGLYLSAALFCLASLLYALIKMVSMSGFWFILLLSFFGLLSLIFAAFELFRESLISLDLVQESRQQMED